ncbi:MAG: acetyl-CoA carboxylase biotin carboxyl carrier protein subunit [Oligoflexia bacterium]|nr:acetyl-CoA carboxylase biotin carboxyl carrier protein subunit [Oligoflexia bacterium]
MKQRNLKLSNGKSLTIHPTAENGTEAILDGKSYKDCSKVTIEKIDAETQKIYLSSKGQNRLIWLYTKNQRRILAWPGGSIEFECSLTDSLGEESSDRLKPIKLSMPGKVLSVKVKPGDKVTKGQALVVVEAMKMENILMASGDGTIDTVSIKEGDRLESGATLITFKAE